MNCCLGGQYLNVSVPLLLVFHNTGGIETWRWRELRHVAMHGGLQTDDREGEAAFRAVGFAHTALCIQSVYSTTTALMLATFQAFGMKQPCGHMWAVWKCCCKPAPPYECRLCTYSRGGRHFVRSATWLDYASHDGPVSWHRTHSCGSTCMLHGTSDQKRCRCCGEKSEEGGSTPVGPTMTGFDSTRSRASATTPRCMPSLDMSVEEK